MALCPRVRMRALALHIRDTLRSGINAQITQAIAETPGDAPATNLATISNTTEQIIFSDHDDYEPVVYPSIRVANPRVRMLPMSSATVVDVQSTYLISVYTEQVAGRGLCTDDIIGPLSETTLDLVECVRACIERDYSSSTFGDLILCQGYERTEAPQDPEDPCVMRLKYTMTWVATARMRHSRGATT